MGDMRHDVLEQKMCKELEMIEEKYRGGAEMSMEDLKKMDLLYHALKSKATYDAMKEAEEYGYEDGRMSGRRGHYYDDRNPGYSGYSMPRPRW